MVQRMFLHDAATSFELDPDDETIVKDDFCLTFDSHRNANKVATLAAAQLNKEATNKSCIPAVIVDGKKYHATIASIQ